MEHRPTLIHNGNCLAVLPTIPDSSVDLVLTDPPYFKVKNEAWDRQWDKPEGFLAWLDLVVAEFARVLKPNGSLYLFASPQMAARVECKIGKRLNVLNRIRWIKEAGWHNKNEKEALRSYLSPWEEIIFAEHYGADNMAKGEAGYSAKCDELRGFVFEPLRVYLNEQKALAGKNYKDIAASIGVTSTMVGQHYFSASQWGLPTASAYKKMQEVCSPFMNRPYESLREEYESLREEYESLRRHFSVTADVPYTDVWTFKTVCYYPGKHPCEKPQDLLRHIITASSRPDAVVLDAFMGTGSTGLACEELGRSFIGIELDKDYCEIARKRISQGHTKPAQCGLFNEEVYVEPCL